jgi:hypothetical protein
MGKVEATVSSLWTFWLLVDFWIFEDADWIKERLIKYDGNYESEVNK